MRLLICLALFCTSLFSPGIALAGGLSSTWKVNVSCPDGTKNKGTLKLKINSQDASGSIKLGSFSGQIVAGGFDNGEGNYFLVVQPPSRPYVDIWHIGYTEGTDLFIARLERENTTCQVYGQH